MHVRALDQLLHAADQIVGVMAFSGAALARVALPDVVDAFQNHHPLHARLRDHVAVEARQGIGGGALAQNAIAGDALIHDGEIPGGGTASSRAASRLGQLALASLVEVAPSVMESPKATISPVLAGARTSTLERKYQERVVWTSPKLGDAGHIAEHEIGGVQAGGVHGQGAGILGEVDTDGELRQLGDGQVNRIADGEGAGRNGEGCLPAELQLAHRGWKNRAPLLAWSATLRRADGQGPVP